MDRRNATQRRARGVNPLRRPSFAAAALVAALTVPVASSPPTHATTDVAASSGLDEYTEQVGDLVRVSDPAPQGPFPSQSSTDDGASARGAQAGPAISDVFSLHSRPGATRKILLDFDGETVISDYWNNGAPIDAAAYSYGSDQSDESFSATDLIEIERIWARVAEDFAAWDVDVTTADPGPAGLARSSAGDVEYGVRVVITPTYTWYSTNKFGGTAYLHTFDRFDDLPAWVFSGNLGNGNAKSVAEAVSHEVGHTLGLSHDGVTTTGNDGSTTTLGYYSGHGDWAPIMGIGYYRPVTQWSRGEYPGATNSQDDLAIIDTYISRLGPSIAGAGVIGPNDSTTYHTLADGSRVDEHPLQIEGGPVTVSVSKADPEGNLLAELRVRNSSGQVIGTAKPSGSVSWSLDITLPVGTPAGLYTVEVESVGWTPSGDPGFTRYASMGGYVLAVDAPESVVTPDTTTATTTTPPPPTTTAPPTTTLPSSTSTAPPTTTVTPPPTPRPVGDRLTAITPRRVLDTRRDDAPVAGLLPPGQATPIAVDGLPADATAVVVNVTAVAPRSAGYFSLTPCGVADGAPTSSLNFSAARNIANSVIVPLPGSGSTAGQICLFSSVPAHALLDLTGWIGPSGELSLEQLGSERLVDTRNGTGISARLPADVRTAISLASGLGSGTVGAVALNVTAIRPTSDGFLTIDDCSAGPQPTSSLNFVAGEIRGNNGVFALGADQQLCVTSSAATHVTIDVTGDFGTAAGLTFVPNPSPERVLDTRDVSRLGPGATATFGVDTAANANSLERPAVAASVNLTATRHDDNGYVTAWACGERPSTSALNPSAGTATANGALVELSPSGTTCLFHATGGHLIVDLAGWWI